MSITLMRGSVRLNDRLTARLNVYVTGKGSALISIRPIETIEWQLYRDLRLQALRDSPDAFASTHKAEAARADEIWSARVAAAFSSGSDRVLFVFNGTKVCGLAWGKLSSAEAGTVDLFQMWVDPESRGLGAGRALLNGVLAWAKDLGAHRVRLGVTTADTPAMRLYKTSGFLPVGSVEPLRISKRVF